MKVLHIFQKNLKANGREFTSYTTKNKKGQICKVTFLSDAEDFITDNVDDNKPFTIEVEPNKIGYRERLVCNDDKSPKLNAKGEQIIERKFYIDDIVSIRPYVREDIDDDII